MSLIIFLIFVTLLFIFTAKALTAIYIYRDASARGMSGPYIWGFLGFLFTLPVLVLYLIARGCAPAEPIIPFSADGGCLYGSCFSSGGRCGCNCNSQYNCGGNCNGRCGGYDVCAERQTLMGVPHSPYANNGNCGCNGGCNACCGGNGNIDDSVSIETLSVLNGTAYGDCNTPCRRRNLLMTAGLFVLLSLVAVAGIIALLF